MAFITGPPSSIHPASLPCGTQGHQLTEAIAIVELKLAQ
jgi:hypothetical protein